MVMVNKEPRRRRLRQALQLLGHRVAGARAPLLDAAGLGLLAAAAGMMAPVAGVAAAGMACLVLSWRLSR